MSTRITADAAPVAERSVMNSEVRTNYEGSSLTIEEYVNGIKIIGRDIYGVDLFTIDMPTDKAIMLRDMLNNVYPCS